MRLDVLVKSLFSFGYQDAKNTLVGVYIIDFFCGREERGGIKLPTRSKCIIPYIEQIGFTAKCKKCVCSIKFDIVTL